MPRDSSAPIASKGPDRSWGFNPLVHCRRVTLAFLQGLFAQCPRGQFHWNADSKISEIYIHDANPVDPEKIGQKPAITIIRSPMQFGQLFMDDMQDFNILDGQRTHSDMLSGTLVLNALSKVGVEAEEIAWFTARHTWILRRMLLRRGFHDVGRGMRVDAVTPAGALVAGDSDQIWRKVSILMPFHFRYSDKLTPTGLEQIENIEFHIDAETGVWRQTRVSRGLKGTSIGRETDSGYEVVREGEEPATPETLEITVEV
jgi:hypothetical protein